MKVQTKGLTNQGLFKGDDIVLIEGIIERESLINGTFGKDRSKIKENIKKSFSKKGIDALRNKEYKKAIELYELELMVEPENPDLNYEYGLTLYYLGRIEESLASYKKTVELDPSYAKAFHNMGIILWENKSINLNSNEIEELELKLTSEENIEIRQTQKAIKMMDKAIKADPSYELAYLRKGCFLNLLGDQSKAFDAFNELSKINYDNAGAWYGMAMVCYNSANFSSAVQCFRIGMSIDPNFNDILIDRERIYTELKEYMS